MCVCVCLCVCVCVCAYVPACVVHICELHNCKQFSVAPLGSLVCSGSAYVFQMGMIHCNGAATRGLNWCRLSHN